LGNGDGTFQPAQMYSSRGDSASAIAVADVNGDGRPDVLVASWYSSPSSRATTGGVAVLLRRQFETITTVTTSANPVLIHQPVTFTAKVTPGGWSAGGFNDYGAIPDGQTVYFHVGTTQIGTGSTVGGVASLTTSTLKEGTYKVTATYEGNLDFKFSSGAVQQAVELNPASTR
jgi:hypothetical protein